MKLKLLRVLASCAMLATMSRSANAAALEVQWNKSNDPTTVGYVIDYGAQSGKYTHHVDVGNTLTLTLDAVNAGSTYYFVVRSYNPSGVRSKASGELTATAVMKAPPTLTSLTIMSQVAPPQTVNTKVEWTATPVGGVAPHQYRWFMFDGEKWWKIGGWTTTATVAWQPTVANRGYVFGVWARSAGSTADAPEMSVIQPFSIAPPVPSGAAALASAGPMLISGVADAPNAGVGTSPAGSLASLSNGPTRDLNAHANPIGSVGTVVFVQAGKTLATERMALVALGSGAIRDFNSLMALAAPRP